MTRFTSSPVKGSSRGKDLGFPTINLPIKNVPESVEEGIYAGWIEMGGHRFPAAIHYGERPVFDDSASFEVHVIDQHIEGVPEEVTIELIEHLRTIQNFESIDDLKAQLQRDVDQARAMLVSDAPDA